MVGSLGPGAALAEGQGGVRSLASQFRGLFPYPMSRDFNADSTAIPLQRDIMGDVRGRLLILLCSVAAVLLIAGANGTSFVLSRAPTRRRGMALRAAFGPGRPGRIRRLRTPSV